MLSLVVQGELMPEADRELKEAGSTAETEEEAIVEAQLRLIATAATDQQPLLNEENDPVANATQSSMKPEE